MFTSFSCKNNKIANEKFLTDVIKNELDVVFDNKIILDASCQLIDGRIYQKNLVILESDVLLSIARKQWKQAEEAALEESSACNIDVIKIREQIVDVLLLCRNSIQECPKGLLHLKLLQYLKLLKNTIISWACIEERSLIKLASPSVKDEQLAICHYFHMYLEVQWLYVTLCYLSKDTLDSSEALLKDLVVFSHSLFKKHSEKNVMQVSAFICPCIKQLWILLQLFNEKLFEMGVTKRCFWEVFNGVLKHYDELFSFWLLHHIAMLQGYNEAGAFLGPLSVRVCANYALIEQKLKSLNVKCTSISSDNNQILLSCCKLLDPLLNQWWIQNAKSEPYQILWEIFNKHLNISFGASKPNSATELVESVQGILKHADTSNSYEYFLYMLNEHLMRFPNQWPRMRGRIYCKLPPHKINDSGDVGLYNIALLFLLLAGSINLAEMTEKLQSLLSNLAEQRQKSPVVLNIYVSLVILHVCQECPVKDVCSSLVQFVQEAANNRDMFRLIRLYIDGFDTVLNASQNFSLQQHVMIGSWISKYLTSCEFGDLCYFLNVLLCNIKRIRNTEAWMEWEPVLKEHVLPGLRLKPVAMSANSPAQVGELAAMIDSNPLSDWVLVFTSDLVTPKVTCQFILTLLEDIAENYTLPKNHETAILHAWIRCCLLNCEDSEKLTSNVMKLRPLSLILGMKWEFAEKPLISFVISMSRSTSKMINLQELCEQCFGRLDSWVISYLKVPLSEAQVIHMYTCIAVLFFHCASLLYHKNRSSCLLNRLISIFLLPTEVLMGNSPHQYVLGAIQRTWHRFVEGIFALDCSSDAYLERTLRDMVLRYVPLLPIDGSPILKCLGNEKLAVMILERLSLTFLARSSRSCDNNTTKALKLVQLALKNASTATDMKMILQSTLTAIFEVGIFSTHKNVALELIKCVSSNDKYEQVKECVEYSIVVVTEKHLAFNTNSYFQFINTLARITPADVRTVLPKIKKQLIEVERMRGVGYDNTLRQGLDHLETILN